MGTVAHDDGLTEGEHLVLRLHPHWKTVLRPVMSLALIIAILLAVLIYLPGSVATGPVRLGIGAAAVLAALLFCLVPLLRWRTTTYELTNRRLRLRAGILSRQGRDFPLARISDVSFSHGLVDRLLGCGQLVVESPGEHGRLVLTEIPHIEAVQSTLFQLVEDEQARPQP
jgi:uncharacterized membrane protein YdbT with pleckstrin-like domain